MYSPIPFRKGMGSKLMKCPFKLLQLEEAYQQNMNVDIISGYAMIIKNRNKLHSLDHNL